MSDEESKLTRRDFVKLSAVATATAAGWYSIAMKTDAMGQQDTVLPTSGPGQGSHQYTYHD